MVNRRIRTALAGSVLAGAAATAFLMVPQANAASAPVSDQVSLSAVTAKVGETVTLTATATNNSAQELSVALGVKMPGVTVTSVRQTNCGAFAPRNTGWLIYCGATSSVAPGDKAVLIITLQADGPGTYSFSSYARELNSSSDDWGSATLTVN